jgi:hypothetical protein
MLALLRGSAQYISVLSSSRRLWLVRAAALCALLGWVYARAADGPFVFDDRTAIVGNASVHRLWPLAPILAQPPDLTTSGRPVVALSYALDFAIAGLDPRVFRATNFAIHLLCALALAGVLKRTLLGPRLAPRFARHADGLAFAAATLFALHPLASELVCYSSARSESLMALFYLSTLYFAIRAHGSTRPWGFVAASVACCALGMASKEVMVSAPLAVALHDRIFLSPPGAERAVGRVQAVLWSGLASTWTVLGGLLLTQPRSESAGFALWLTPLVYLANQCRVLPEYLRLVVWPAPLRLDYGLPEPLGLGDVWLGAGFLVVLFGLTLYALWRWPAAGFVGIVCFALLSPSSSVVPIASEVGAERRMYLPLAALLSAVVCWIWLALVRLGGPRLAPVLVGVAALTLASVSAARAGVYTDEIALWRADLRAAPGNPRARYNLSSALRAAGFADDADRERAQAVRGEIEFYTRILPHQPDRVLALQDLAALHVAAGEYARADALYGELLALAPDDATALRRRALVRTRLEAASPSQTPDPRAE